MIAPEEIRAMVTRRDYNAIAATFSDEIALLDLLPNADAERGVVWRLARRLALVLKADNPKFDTARFLKACGLPKAFVPGE